MMVLFCCEAVGGKFEDAMNASAALEMLHNFTLVHDDIMDNADSRRGRETVHKKWNSSVAILTGDQLIGLAYSYLSKTNSIRLDEITDIFTNGIIEVCEGQSYDKEFEARKDVTLDEYMMMIRKKTAKMLETSAAIGAIIGNADDVELNNIKNYAMNIGLAFQIQDDLLDVVADENEFGKKIGGDLVEGKKTFLLLKALESVKNPDDREKIMEIVLNNGLSEWDEIRISEIRNIYERHGVFESAQTEIENFTRLADEFLDTLPDGDPKERLKWFSEMLMSRSF